MIGPNRAWFEGRLELQAISPRAVKHVGHSGLFQNAKMASPSLEKVNKEAIATIVLMAVD